MLIETLWPKQRILEVYLNVAEFGKACLRRRRSRERLLSQSRRALIRADAALLAAVLPNPKRMRVNAPSRYVRVDNSGSWGRCAASGRLELT